MWEQVKSELRELRQDLVTAQARVADLKLKLVMAMILEEQIKKEIENHGGEN